ncbi:hypothetical protein E2F50_17805 [Rhizobium deserti]|uniref:MOFRL domain-containing protein n=1 Tax=Rhizobium deserti TaxID=2547961 RepID=A0A4R5UB83_9HYPH|nr:hypothetical protein E2F50_17805 [Rhizobium deserti]
MFICGEGLPITCPAALTSRDEGIVTIRNSERGRGGRNTKFLTGLAQALKGASKIWALPGDTDGMNGHRDWLAPSGRSISRR